MLVREFRVFALAGSVELVQRISSYIVLFSVYSLFLWFLHPTNLNVAALLRNSSSKNKEYFCWINIDRTAGQMKYFLRYVPAGSPSRGGDVTVYV